MSGEDVKKIILHREPHFDDLLAAVLLALFGGEKHLCSPQTVSVVTVEDRGPMDNERLLAGRTIAIGTGGGPLDDHGDPKKRTASQLVVEYLGIQDKVPQRVLDYALLNDKLGRGEFLGFADLVRAMNRFFSPQDVFEWFLGTMKAVLKREEQFAEAVSEIWGAAQIVLVDCRAGARHLIVVESDLPDAARAAREKIIKGDFALYLLIVRRSNGHTVVLSDHGVPEVVLRDLAKAVRYEEQSAGGKVTLWGWKELGGDGTRSEVPEWYLDAKGGMLLNGSESAQGVEPTRLTLKQVISLATLAISDLPPEGCTDPCPKRNCPIYPYGFSRCCAARNRQK